MEKEEIRIPPITLEWSEWFPWSELENSVVRPPEKSGVYEVKYKDSDEKRLTIGKAKNLYKRIVRGLVLGKLKHSSGKKIRQFEDTSKIVVRWAETDRPAAVEEELHKCYKDRYRCLPKYTKIT